MLSGSGQQVSRSAAPQRTRSTRTFKTAGVSAEANLLVSSMRNTVNPMSRSREGAGGLVRAAVGIAGIGSWRKRMPPCNGADKRCNITLLRKRAHFQPVVRDENECRTTWGGNRK